MPIQGKIIVRSSRCRICVQIAMNFLGYYNWDVFDFTPQSWGARLEIQWAASWSHLSPAQIAKQCIPSGTDLSPAGAGLVLQSSH